jgi:branched-chain amino acid aminotransferase
MSLLWVNGELIDKAAARVSPFDHGFLYGDGVWEHLRVFDGEPFRASDQLAHLFAAARLLDIDIPLSLDELVAAVGATVRANARTRGYVRVVVTRGPGTIGPDPRKIDPQVLITAEEYLPFPSELYEHGLHVVTCAAVDREYKYHTVRTLGAPHVVGAKAAALRVGCLDAILLDRLGRVAGTTEGRLFVVKNGEVRRGWGAHDVAADIPATDDPELSIADVLAADEAFIAGTTCGVIAVVRCDKRDIGSGAEGPVTRAIRASVEA